MFNVKILIFIKILQIIVYFYWNSMIDIVCEIQL